MSGNLSAVQATTPAPAAKSVTSSKASVSFYEVLTSITLNNRKRSKTSPAHRTA